LGQIIESYDELNNYKNLFKCNSFEINYKNKKIFYSGDCNYVDFHKHNYYDAYYIETCLDKNEVHYNINILYQDCLNAKIDIKKIWCMHFENDDTIKRAVELGFNIVELI
jgi:hypothetical protein